MTAAKISLIAAVAENGVIGKGNELPWRIKSEMQYFKRTTSGKPVVMGRKSFESLGKPLTDRTNIIISRNPEYRIEGCVTVTSLDEGLAAAQEVAARDGVDEIFIGGGADIYRQTLPLADRLYLTDVHLTPEGDTLFPAFDRAGWREVKREFHAAKDGESADYTITVLERAEV
ncbi:MAG: dihydrofolate reductase [Alphaproteobacteria bacterium]|nr:dihydrofolate reductase [Alphaproteobacteria bacterium]